MKKLIVVFLSCLMIPIYSHAQMGRVGINTTTPAAMLHVKDSNVVFTGLAILPSMPGNPPVSGAGTRMMWYPDKAAFRAGSVEGDQWNKVNIGDYSAAMGFNTTSSGASSTAMGRETTASGSYSTAMGRETTASHFHTTAMGFGTLASGHTSTAMGIETTASGVGSTALGSTTTASGSYSTAMGEGTTASAYGATAMGLNTVASGQGSTAMGMGTIANGQYSTALGNSTFANGQNSIATGFGTSATGISSTAIGYATNASGLYSGAIGFGTTASGASSVAMGQETIANGILSTAMGYHTKSNSFASLVLGRFNDTTSISFASWEVLDPAFIIGNGSSDMARANAFTVLKNGRTGINTHDPKAMFHIVRNGASGGPFHSNSAAIIESNLHSYIQFSQTNTTESGILSGNNLTAIRSALIFAADSTIALRTGGNNTRMVINKAGNVGIGTGTPGAKLEVNGTTIIGVNGTAITEIIKITITKNINTVVPAATGTETFVVANAQLGSTVFISPEDALPDGLVIASARVSAAGTIEVKFSNITAGNLNAPSMVYYITVIR